MTFDEWLTDFFHGVFTPPPHIVYAYKSAYEAGVNEGRSLRMPREDFERPNEEEEDRYGLD